MKNIHLSVLLITFLSCSDDFRPIDFERDSSLPQEYTYEVSNSCFCSPDYLGPHFLHIKGDQIVDYELLVDEMIFDSSYISSLTIESITERVNSTLEQEPVVSNIDLHPIYGFPIRGFFDIAENLADDEWGFTITNFTVIED